MAALGLRPDCALALARAVPCLHPGRFPVFARAAPWFSPRGRPGLHPDCLPGFVPGRVLAFTRTVSRLPARARLGFTRGRVFRRPAAFRRSGRAPRPVSRPAQV
ncbi:hypothetical protein SCA03_08380 [Streptomyces cacaoi]|uniref:Uncharacterized protein n=1 Tax=Streptomyces cacaoi TaxID=1898 RepID=A0A4Y3QUB9_STRCI|nr:hypothetical protein SCA03_08380 [Streptomyces cacaoi]